MYPTSKAIGLSPKKKKKEKKLSGEEWGNA